LIPNYNLQNFNSINPIQKIIPYASIEKVVPNTASLKVNLSWIIPERKVVIKTLSKGVVN
jgi:hypothetical protein